jgi:DNA-binding transcriptional LysR family regulator
MSGLEHFSDNQVRALRALVEHGSTTAAAEATGLTARTIQRYREDEDFAAHLRRLRGEILQETVGAMLAAGSEAVATLERGMSARSENGPLYATQVRAASRLLALMLRGVELAALEERVSELERKAQHVDQ